MFTIFTGLALAAAAATAPAADEKPPIQFPASIEGMSVKPGFDQPFNIGVSYASPGETVSLYLFRATHPNAALWFERAEAILQEMWKARGLGSGGETRQVKVAGAATPNGLTRVFAVSGPQKSTGLAVAQLGGWMVKVRSSSATLSPAEQLERMERILLALGSTGASGSIHPLELPAPCPAESQKSSFEALLGSEAIARPNGETIIAAGPALIGAAEQVRGGKDSLAASPNLWCRAPLEGASVIGALYRPKDPARSDWTALLADSGTSLSGLKTTIFKGKETKEGGMLAANGLDKSRVIMIAEGVPAPEVSFPVGAREIVSGSKAALVAVAYGSGNLEMSLPK